MVERGWWLSGMRGTFAFERPGRCCFIIHGKSDQEIENM